MSLSFGDGAVDGRGTLAALIGAGEGPIFLPPRPLPVHSAHVGHELEVRYRYHPYFSRKVLVRRIEQRAAPIP